MQSSFFGNQPQVYLPLWNKYRPSILKMMMAAEAGPQQYKFYSHEFKAMKPTEKSFSFELLVEKGKTPQFSKLPLIAQELLSVLQYSKKATELMGESNYTIKLDRNFHLHVTRLANPA
jgi:hypothetical protein